MDVEDLITKSVVKKFEIIDVDNNQKETAPQVINLDEEEDHPDAKPILTPVPFDKVPPQVVRQTRGIRSRRGRPRSTSSIGRGRRDLMQDRVRKLEETVASLQSQENEEVAYFKTLLEHIQHIPAFARPPFREALHNLVIQFAYGAYDIPPEEEFCEPELVNVETVKFENNFQS